MENNTFFIQHPLNEQELLNLNDVSRIEVDSVWSNAPDTQIEFTMLGREKKVYWVFKTKEEADKVFTWIQDLVKAKRIDTPPVVLPEDKLLE